MNGKNKCKILKDIRRQIARDNDIAFVTSECKYQGDCAGTCPKCEAEVRYLEEALRKRQQAGKAVAVAGIAAALVVTASGCVTAQTGGDPLPSESGNSAVASGTTAPDKVFMGVPLLPEPTVEDEQLMGDLLPDMGEVAVPEYNKTDEPVG